MSDRRRTYLNNLVENMTFIDYISENSMRFNIDSSDNTDYDSTFYVKCSYYLGVNLSSYNRLMIIGSRFIMNRRNAVYFSETMTSDTGTGDDYNLYTLVYDLGSDEGLPVFSNEPKIEKLSGSGYYSMSYSDKTKMYISKDDGYLRFESLIYHSSASYYEAPNNSNCSIAIRGGMAIIGINE